MTPPHISPRCGQYPAALIAASRIDSSADDLLDACMESVEMREMLVAGLRLLVKSGSVNHTEMILRASGKRSTQTEAKHSSDILHAALRSQPAAAHGVTHTVSAKYFFQNHQHDIIGQSDNLPDEIISFTFSFLYFVDLLSAATACRCWQLASRQRGAATMLSVKETSQMESLLASNFHSLLESRHLSISSLTLIPERPLHSFFENEVDVFLLPFCGDSETNDDDARALERVELNGNLPFSSNVLSNMFLRSSTTLQCIDLSAGQYTMTLTFPGIPFPNLYCLRACDDWWQLDFDEGFSCDGMLYLGLRPSPAARKQLPQTWQTWLCRLKHLRRLILLVDDDTDTDEEAVVPFHEQAEAREHSAAEGGVSNAVTHLNKKTHFSAAVLDCLQSSFSELVEIRLFDFTLAGSDRAFDIIHRGIVAHQVNALRRSLSKLEDLSFAAPSAIHEAKLQGVGWHPARGEHGWGGSTSFKRSERDEAEDTIPRIESSQLNADTIYSPTWSPRTSAQWIALDTSVYDNAAYSPCNTSASASSS